MTRTAQTAPRVRPSERRAAQPWDGFVAARCGWESLGVVSPTSRNVLTIPDEPYVSATGCKYDGGSYAGAQRKVMEIVNYDGFRERQRTARGEGRYLGVGFSPFLEPGGWSGELAKRMGFPFDYMDSARVTVEPDGSVVATLGLHSHGQAHQTTMAQVIADKLGVPIEGVKIVQGDTSQTAYGSGTFGSRGAVIGYGAISRAAAEVADKLKQIAGHSLEIAPEDLELRDGNAVVRGSPEQSMAMMMIAFTAYFGAFVGGTRPAGIDPVLTSTRSYDPPETYANGCAAAIVEVDVETGVVTVERVAASVTPGIESDQTTARPLHQSKPRTPTQARPCCHNRTSAIRAARWWYGHAYRLRPWSAVDAWAASRLHSR